MTLLTLAQENSILIRPRRLPAELSRWFASVNASGRITAILGAAIIVSVLAYLAGLVALFHFGLTLQRISSRASELEQDVLRNQIALQQDDADFLTAHQDILQSMEKISEIRYLPLDHATALAPEVLTGREELRQ